MPPTPVAPPAEGPALAEPTHVRQLDGSPFAGHNCMAASGAMALDAYSGGKVRPSAAEIRRRQSDQSGGIGLDDVAEAWRSYGYRFAHGPRVWRDVMHRLGQGRGAVLPIDYSRVGSYSAQPSYRSGHAVYASRSRVVNGAPSVTVYDPLAPGPAQWPAAILQRAWAPYGTAGWGTGPAPAADAGGAAGDPVGDFLRGLFDGTVSAPAGIAEGIAGAAADAAWGVGTRLAVLVGIVVLGLLGVVLLFREGPPTVVVRGLR